MSENLARVCFLYKLLTIIDVMLQQKWMHQITGFHTPSTSFKYYAKFLSLPKLVTTGLWISNLKLTVFANNFKTKQNIQQFCYINLPPHLRYAKFTSFIHQFWTSSWYGRWLFNSMNFRKAFFRPPCISHQFNLTWSHLSFLQLFLLFCKVFIFQKVNSMITCRTCQQDFQIKTFKSTFANKLNFVIEIPCNCQYIPPYLLLFLLVYILIL